MTIFKNIMKNKKLQDLEKQNESEEKDEEPHKNNEEE